jgi:plastocyanin
MVSVRALDAAARARLVYLTIGRLESSPVGARRMIPISGAVIRIAIPLFALVGSGVVAAQGTVAGQLTILERPGDRSTDLADAVVYLEPGGGRVASTTPGTHQIVMEDKRFAPHVRLVTTGSTVEFPNNDPFRHNVFSKSGPSEFDLGLYGRGDTRGAPMRRPGVYPIFCNIHSQMVAYVVAVSTPYHTQARQDGRFEIENVPAGTYLLRVWHGRGGEHAQELRVAASGVRDISVQLDARGYQFVQHKNKFGQEYSIAGRDRY